MSVTIWVPLDAAARSVGADAVATALQQELIQRGIVARVARNGSRGMLWLEPLVEVETPLGRVGYGPVTAEDVKGLLDGGLMEGAPHPLRQGVVDALPWMASQQRLCFARCGLIEPLSIADYQAHGGFAGLRRALALGPAATIEEVVSSGLRGRGGAGFPTGIKWRTVAGAEADQRYIVCNADEGDSGTFADRMLMEGDPFTLIEGMTIAGIATGATKGFIYIRSEYPDAFAQVEHAIRIAESAGLLGDDVLGSGHRFHLEARLGAGAYICGEETSLLESLEGRRGQIRFKPPLPAIKGLFGKPTVVNNVISLASVPWILTHGAEAYRDFGITLRQLVEDFGGGTATGRPVRAVQVGGPLGAYWPTSLLDTPFDYEAFAQKGGMVGHGGIVVFDDTVDLAKQARFAFAFCSYESCGKCTPCRIGSTRGAETIDKIIRGEDVARNLRLVDDLCEVLTDGSLCALGGLTPVPVQSAIRHFPEDFDRAAMAVAAE